MGQIIRDRRRECDSDCAMTYGRAGADDIVETPAAHRFAPMWRRLASMTPTVGYLGLTIVRASA